MPKVSSSAATTSRPGKRRLPSNDREDELREGENATEALESLRSIFGELRSLLHCKICFRMLYEPYTLSCGHTYCYTCLDKWFDNDRRKKTCPDCRAGIYQAPTPAYLVRDVTNKFLAHDHLLPDGETVLQHSQWQKEEADAVERDRSSTAARGGLFHGCFKSDTARIRRAAFAPFRDVEDGVDRCPICHWELEGDACVRCEYRLATAESEEEDMQEVGRLLSVDDLSDASEDVLSDESGDDEQQYTIWPGRSGPHTRNTRAVNGSARRLGTGDSDDLDAELDMEDQELEDDLNAFPADGHDTDDTNEQLNPPGVRHAHSGYVRALLRSERALSGHSLDSADEEDADDEEDDDEGSSMQGFIVGDDVSADTDAEDEEVSFSPIADASEEDDTDESIVIPGGPTAVPHRRRVTVVVDSDSDSSSE